MFGYERVYVDIKVKTLKLLVEDGLRGSGGEVDESYSSGFIFREYSPRGVRSCLFVFCYKGRKSEISSEEIIELDFSNLKELVERVLNELTGIKK